MNPITLNIPANEIDLTDSSSVQPVIDAIAQYVDAKEFRPYSREEIEGMMVRVVGLVR